MRISTRTFILIVAAVLLFLDGLVVVPLVRQWLARGFVAIEGTVSASATSSYSAGLGRTGYELSLEYEYSVNGTVYRGSRYRYDSSTKLGVNQDEAGFWPKGRKLTIYYNPRNPQDALLSPGIAGNEVLDLIVLTPFNAVPLLFVLLIRAQKTQPQNETVGGVELVPQNGKICARLLPIPMAFLIVISFSLASFGAGLISSMCLTDGLYFHAVGATGVTVIWLIALCAGMTPVLVYRRKVREGRYDLVIDESGATVDLPPICGRKQRRRIPFAEIQRIGLSVRPTRGDEVFVPTLEVAGSLPIREDLTVMKNREQALEFIIWLRQELPHAQQTSGDAEIDAWLDWLQRKSPPPS